MIQRSTHKQVARRQSKPLLGIAYLTSMLCFSLAFAEIVDQSKGNISLEPSKSFKPEDYSAGPPSDLKKSLNDYQEKKENQTKKIRIDLKQAIEEADKASVIDSAFDKTQANSFSISDIRAKALKNNLSIEVAKIDPAIAGAALRQEQAKFDNIIFAYAQQSNRDTPRISSDNIGIKSNDNDLNGREAKLSILEQNIRTTDISAGVKVPLRTGGTVTLSSPIESKRDKGVFGSEEYRSAMRFSISQPLLRNAGKTVNEASIRVSEFNQQAIQYKTKLLAIRIIAMTDKSYWSLYEAWAQLDVRRQQYRLAIQNLNMVKRRVTEGLTAAIELNRAEIGVADRMEALIIAETNLKLAQRQLRFYMNDMDTEDRQPNIINTITEPNLVRYEFDREKLLNEALSARLELLELEVKLAADAINIQYLENQTLPLFTLDYQYGALSPSVNNLGNVYQNTLNGQFSDWSVGLKFEMPFTNEANKGRLEEAVQQRNKRLATKQLQTLTVKKEIYDALDQVENNWQRILAARQQVVIAGLNYDAELKQFNEGLRTMTEVLETLTRLGEAQIKEVRAVSDYQASFVDTAYATGTVLGYSKLDF
ncbi:TolC family protein [Candidatus Methylopumilus rimovensis]|uniref:TolC family protein n=1 Tax=Candidatus Methylopumilus rimovensis TaxID=2588535 RepID=UPI001CB8AF33|nr:TolC family protein [Candidatus Methylopumilus rimovensis]